MAKKLKKRTDVDVLVLRQINLICRNQIKFNLKYAGQDDCASSTYRDILNLIYEQHPIKSLEPVEA